jgi:hypothetical protein
MDVQDGVRTSKTASEGGGLASAGIVIGLWAGIAGTAVCPPLWFAIPIFLCGELFYEQLVVPALYSEWELYGGYEPRIIHHTLDPSDLDRRIFIH